MTKVNTSTRKETAEQQNKATSVREFNETSRDLYSRYNDSNKQRREFKFVERRILRTIMGPKIISETDYLPRTNQEILSELPGENIVKE